MISSPNGVPAKRRTSDRQTLPGCRHYKARAVRVQSERILGSAHLYQIQPPDPLAGRAALGAHAANDQAMAGHPKLVLAGDRLAKTDELVAFELDQLVAVSAVQMVVLWVAIVVLINRPAAEHHGPQ